MSARPINNVSPSPSTVSDQLNLSNLKFNYINTTIDSKNIDPIKLIAHQRFRVYDNLFDVLLLEKNNEYKWHIYIPFHEITSSDSDTSKNLANRIGEFLKHKTNFITRLIWLQNCGTQWSPPFQPIQTDLTIDELLEKIKSS